MNIFSGIVIFGNTIISLKDAIISLQDAIISLPCISALKTDSS